MAQKEELAKIVSARNVTDDPKTLEAYSKDYSFAPPRKPSLVVKPQNLNEVQSVVKWANDTLTPLVPVSSGAPHFRGDTVPKSGDAIIIDLSRMNRIIRANRRNRVVLVEPGVTWSQLQPELAKQGMRVCMPLCPRDSKSVVTSLLEREPTLTPRYDWDLMGPLRCMEIVYGTGDKLWTGEAGYLHGDLEEQWEAGGAQIAPDIAQIGFNHLVSGAQGTMGIVTWASARCELLPQCEEAFFVTSKTVDKPFAFLYKFFRFRYGDELLILNNWSLASLLHKNADEIKALSIELPNWVLILTIAGYDRLPKERVEFQRKDVLDLAQQCGVKLESAISGVTAKEVINVLRKPSEQPYWKLRYKNACQDVFFLTTLDKTPGFVTSMYSMAEEVGYPASEIGVYIQPQMLGGCCHCEFDIPFDQNNPSEVAKVRELYIRSSELLMSQGAYFSRPYGLWADMVYNRDGRSADVLRKTKEIFDPKNILNPGRLFS